MTAKLENALKRLNSVLPLKDWQEACGQEDRKLHRQILQSFVERGCMPSRQEMRQSVSNVEASLEVLKEHGLVVFSGDGEPLGAYPFTMESREHVVRVNGHRIHAMCALDALAIAPMFDVNTEVVSRCRVTGDPVCIQQSGRVIVNPAGAGDIHVAIFWGAADADTSCADSLCLEMMFLRDSGIARDWLAGDPDTREIYSLEQAVEFADRFFTPLVD